MSPDRPVAYVLGSFPQASQTFIAREIRGLKRLGVPLLLFALGRKDPGVLEDADRQWCGDVRFTPFALSPSALSATLYFLLKSPATYLRTLTSLVTLPHRPRALVGRVPALMLKAAWIAREILRAGGCRQVHAHFALAQTEVAMAISGLLGCRFSFTAHARDIYASPSALEEKIRAAALVVTCTAYNVDYLHQLCPDVPPDRITLVHHGIDLGVGSSRERDKTRHLRPEQPVILAAGRLIDKKGFDTLISACGELRRRGLEFRCRIVGTGPLAGALRKQIESATLSSLIELPGWLPADQLAREMEASAVFAMPSRVSDSGDRDGIPNVVLEAMAAGVPVVGTDVSGIPEAVANGETGLIVPANSPRSLADALERVLRDADLARTLAASGLTRVRAEFALDVSSQRLARLFDSSSAS